MTDCSNVEIRELLPDLVSGQLSRADADRVGHHVAQCADCADELAILRATFAARPAAVAVDVSRIVAALPAPRTVRPPERFARPTRTRAWRIAAALAVVTVGGVSWQVAQHGGFGILTDTPAHDSVLQVAADSQRDDNAPLWVLSGDMDPVSVSFGDIGDYTDEELELMLQRLEQWDGATSTEPMSFLPLLPGEGEGR